MERTFEVWAPSALRVELQVDGLRHSMIAGEGGWWSTVVEADSREVDYGYVLDGDGPFPDPRSHSQPNGVHGLSRTVDHGSFKWTDTGWQAPPLSAGLAYEIHIGTFSAEGTFQSAERHLDHLVDLGVTHVEIMPVNEFSGERGWGYDGVDLFAPHHRYGGPQGFKQFVNSCHERNLAVILDVVYNHLGPAGNYLERFGPYFTGKYQTLWGDAVNLDGEGSDEVRRFFIDSALMWLTTYHLDGLRLDAVHAFHDESAYTFLEQLGDEVKKLKSQLGRHLVLIAESDLNDPKIVRPREAHGFGMDAQWSDDFHHALHVLLTGENDGYYEDFGSVGHLAKALMQAYVYDGVFSRHRGRHHGRRPLGLDGSKFFGYIQNHDQVGNRARGERLCHLVSHDHAKLAAALVLTAPFIPMLFQGEEWGASTPFQYFTAHEEPDLGDAVRRGRREEFSTFAWGLEDIPDPQDRATFEASKLKWSELESKEHAELLAWYKQMIAIRRQWPELLSGSFHEMKVSFDEKESWLVMTRGRVRVACNFSRTRQALDLEWMRSPTLVAHSKGQPTLGESTLTLDPVSVAVLVSE